ncbi:MAG TPA: GNAT family N-acetyltransferase [Blastocatellia bacterium]|jgi:GNAT superfamily N-acetyltransferase|nr:GNAT family N-acetyltransferase [Blastocatellia bacterium]
MSDAPEIIIRLAGPADAPSLARLRYEFRSGHDPATEDEADFLARCGAWMAARLAPGSPWRCWVAEDAGRLVGAIWLQFIEKIPNPGAEAEKHGYISNLYVEPSRRGDGLGSMLIDTCVRFCEKEAVDAMILWPTPRSRPLYERHGFAVRDDLLERRMDPIPSH